MNTPNPDRRIGEEAAIIGMSRGRKLRVGDWVITPEGAVAEIHYVATSYTYVSDIRGTQYKPGELKRLPAHPAVLAKTYKLLIANHVTTQRYIETSKGWNQAVRASEAMRRHMTRILKVTSPNRRTGATP